MSLYNRISPPRSWLTIRKKPKIFIRLRRSNKGITINALHFCSYAIKNFAQKRHEIVIEYGLLRSINRRLVHITGAWRKAYISFYIGEIRHKANELMRYRTWQKQTKYWITLAEDLPMFRPLTTREFVSQLFLLTKRKNSPGNILNRETRRDAPVLRDIANNSTVILPAISPEVNQWFQLDLQLPISR